MPLIAKNIPCAVRVIINTKIACLRLMMIEGNLIIHIVPFYSAIAIAGSKFFIVLGMPFDACVGVSAQS